MDKAEQQEAVGENETEEREAMEFWYVDKELLTVYQVTGFSTDHPTAWWCPGMSITAFLGKDIFEDKCAAIAVARFSAVALMRKAKRALARLDEMENE